MSAAGAQLAGWAALAMLNTVVITASVPWPQSGWVRLAHHSYDAGNLLALGWLSAGAVAAWQRWGSRQSWWAGAAALFGTALLAAWLVLDEDLAGSARKLSGLDGSDAWLYFLLVLAAAIVTAAAAVGSWLARPRWRWGAVAVAALAMLANHRLHPHSYDGVHLWLAWCAAVFAGTALCGVRIPRWRMSRPARNALIGFGASLCALTLLWWPRNAVVIELYRTPGTALTPFLARVHFEDVAPRPVVGASASWFVPRDDTAEIPPTEPRLVGDDTVVILLSIDAMRPDVFDEDKWARHIPLLRALKGDSVDFTMARSAGAQTVYTVTSLFSGKYFSQMLWARRGERARKNKKTSQLWPWDDPTPRFPETLAAAGIPTFTSAPTWWLRNTAGVVRGFDEVAKVPANSKMDYGFPLARDVMEPVLERLSRHGDGPLFVFVHFMDPHWPYTRGGNKGNARERHVKEIGVVDREIVKMLDVLERRGLWARTVLMITSDHGEAFGEHGVNQHATILYDEVLRVPTYIRVPGVEGREVGEPVTTVDLGPTILDLYGLPTPGHFMGQSLVPLLQGRDVQLSRPIVAETRLKQALVTRDGLKAIRDLRRGTLEAYDLVADPGETINIVETDAGADVLNQLRLFFSVHTYDKDGYEVPLRL